MHHDRAVRRHPGGPDDFQAVLAGRLVRDVRRLFPGRLTYSGNWDHYQKVGLYDLVDSMGVCGYFSLARRGGATPQPALTQAWLEQIPVGQWTVSDVRYWLGEPQRVERVARFEGEVWTYRFLQLSDPRFAYLHIDPSGTVQRVLFVDDVSNAPDDRP